MQQRQETYVFISTYEARANRDTGLTVHPGGRGGFRQKLLGDKPEHRIGFAFISGTSDELRNKLQRCVIGCALKNQIITRQESAIFTLCSLSRQALTHALTNTITGDHIRLKIALVSTSRWLAVAMYGEAQVYQRITQEIMGLCLHRYPPA